MKKSHPIVIIFSILAALQVLTGAAALGDLIGEQAFGMFAIIVAAVQVGMTFYVENTKTVPLADQVAYVDQDGKTVAGPASNLTTGSVVKVEQSPPSTDPGLF